VFNPHNQEWNPRHTLITGASSGLGAGLAEGIAAPGRRLTLLARRSSLLAEVAGRCSAKGADVDTVSGDVRERDAMKSRIEAAHAQSPLHLVIANAGIGGGPGITPDDIYVVNMDGLRHTVEPSLELMERQGFGQIAIMSSLAGFRGLGSAPAYSASKVFARGYGEALQGRYRHRGIDISVICPGFVDTPMTRTNPFAMPFLMDESRARRIMLRGLARRRARIAYPWPTYWFSALLPLMPAWLVERVFNDRNSKE
jgi:short-subunit dehydrogenase